MYTMIHYKSKVMHVGDYILNLSPIRQNKIPILGKKTNVVFNADLSSNNITEIINMVLFSLHSGGAKYRIQSSKT